MELRWSAPAGCPQADDIRLRVRSYTHEEAGGELRVEASIVPSASAWRMVLTLNDEAKTIEGASCSDLAEAAAIVISLALAPDQPEPANDRTRAALVPLSVESEATSRGDLGDMSTRNQPQPHVGRAVEPAPPTLREPGPAPTIPPDQGALLRLDLGLRYGVTPAFAGDTALALGLWRRRARIELAGTFWHPRDQPLQGLDGAVARVTLGSVKLRGCFAPRSGRLTVPLCGALRLGAVRVRERFVAGGTVQHGLWAGASAGAGVAYAVRPRIALSVSTEATASLRRSRFSLPVTGETYTVGPFAIQVALGVEMRFI